ncbi:MAG: hypothetical protein AAF328_04375 [Planctomycetota bacterium]
MRWTHVACSVLSVAAVSIPVSAMAQTDILYLSRSSQVAYFEQDVDPFAVPPFQEPITFSVADTDATQGFDTFNSLLVYPPGGTPFSETSAGQFSRLFADAIEFSGQAFANEDPTDNLFGVYTAGAKSEMTVVFDILDEVDFTLTGQAFDAASANGLGTTSLTLTGPGVNINTTQGPIDFAGTFVPGRYTFDAFIESRGVYDDAASGLERTPGRNVGFDALLLLSAISNGIVGDYDGSGQVEQGDLNLVLNNWGEARGDWTNADGFATANVDQEELNRVLNNWGTGVAPTFTGVNVPEPAMAFGVAGWAMLLKRKKPTD